MPKSTTTAWESTKPYQPYIMTIKQFRVRENISKKFDGAGLYLATHLRLGLKCNRLTDFTWRQDSFKRQHTVRRGHKLRWRFVTIKTSLSFILSAGRWIPSAA